MLKLLITGGAGFIGSAVIRHAIKDKNFKILNLDKLTYAGNLESISFESSHKNYSFKNLDINDADGLAYSFNTFRPNFVMHLAAESHVDRSIEGPADFINTNINGTFNLLEQARKYFEGLSID